jgi:hypothetical protein
MVDNYFDLAQTSTDLNTQIAATEIVIDPGTYSFVKMEFCKTDTGESTGEPNVKFKGG